VLNMSEVVYYDRDGKPSKKVPKGCSRCVFTNLVDGEGCSAEDGILTLPTLNPNREVKRRVKKR